MKELDRSKIWLPYLLGTLGISYVLWLSIIIGNQFGLLTFGEPLMMILYTLGANVPPIMAFVLLIRSKQRTFSQLLKTVFTVKQPLKYYVIAIGFSLIYSIIPLLLNQARIIAPFYIPILMLPIMMIFGGGLEEIGWRFILQPALEQKMGFIGATLATGAVWALWHLPLFFMQGTTQYTWSFWAFALEVMGMAFALAALYKISRSTWLCILFHSLVNALKDSIYHDMTDVRVSAIVAVFMIVLSMSLLKVMAHQTKQR